ncbi:hypothetical protein SLS55_003349 [Diplodia seriata]|uniref:Uncharacterized protein n=1 Tax=Diplodia seriata TaxID=420778 RepID=A0A0G2EGY4_9PEZI|nr:hypothetical protein UCDDS831_g03959 [Diplodia seriata]OMP88968.1 hypothetical protein BK809_0005689 [Diplodia seriata]
MSITDSTSFVVPPSNSSDDDVDSLPSEATTESLDYDENEAEREWRESLQQLELLLTMVVVPYLGKYFGRKCAYWGWAKFMEWKYPVEVQITSSTAFKAAGAVEAAASL